MDVIAYVCTETDRSKVRVARPHTLVKDGGLTGMSLISGPSNCLTSRAPKQARCC